LICSGGEEVLLDVGGQDSTEAFEDVGHSDEAREILDGLLVGNLKRQVRFLTFILSTALLADLWPLLQHPPLLFTLRIGR
jgi:cytochrome b involved in lipid metabolism